MLSVKSYVNCQFPSHSPFPGGLVNYKVDLLSFDYDSKNTSTDDQLLCIESSNQLRIIKPIPLSYKDKTIRVKINFDSYKDFLITPKEYRISKLSLLGLVPSEPRLKITPARDPKQTGIVKSEGEEPKV